MPELNRRDMLRGVAAGTALVGGLSAAADEPKWTERLQAHRAAAWREVPVPAHLPGHLCGLSPVRRAAVAMVRSWQMRVLLQVEDGAVGLCAVDDRTLAIAAAAQAAGRPVFVRYFGHEPDGAAGVGSFAGVLLAFDAQDLGGEPEVGLP